MPDFETIVIGAGPTGLTTALAAARHGSVLVCEPRVYNNRLRVDSVPVSLLALFVEFGVHPAELRASMVHDLRLVTWSGSTPVASKGAASVHVLRPHVDRALLAKVRSHARITLRRGAPPEDLRPRRGIFGATGRRSLTAERILAPASPAMCRSVFQLGTFAPAQQALRIAALPGGYAYRLGTADTMTLGLVLDRLQWGEAGGSVASRIRHGGAGWLLAGMSAIEDAPPGQGGAASVQWTIGSSAIARVGDADFARDALAGQGMATGISSALRALGGEGQPDRPVAADDRKRHLHSLREITLACRYADSFFWRSYREFLSHNLLVDPPDMD